MSDKLEDNRPIHGMSETQIQNSLSDLLRLVNNINVSISEMKEDLVRHDERYTQLNMNIQENKTKIEAINDHLNKTDDSLKDTRHKLNNCEAYQSTLATTLNSSILELKKEVEDVKNNAQSGINRVEKEMKKDLKTTQKEFGEGIDAMEEELTEQKKVIYAETTLKTYKKWAIGLGVSVLLMFFTGITTLIYIINLLSK